VGTGRALVIVHGSLTTGREWLPFATILASRYACHLVDRRGHGDSGDSCEYSLEKERDDIRAVINACGDDVLLLGHSYGAICALAAAADQPVSNLVLYEPPQPVPETLHRGALDRIREAVSEGRREEALMTGLRDIVHMDTPDIERLRSTPLWTKLAAFTPTWLRELQQVNRFERGFDSFSSVAVPTLLIGGEDSVLPYRGGLESLEKVLPNATSIRVAGQGHYAHLTGTAALAAEVVRFLEHG
jgi:pimeloyl-ACP methyl ester carboxylesterase